MIKKKFGHQLDKKHTAEDRKKIAQNLRSEFADDPNYQPLYRQLLKDNPIEKRY